MKQDNTAFDEYMRTHKPVTCNEWNDAACLKLAALMIENAKLAYINARYDRIKQEQKIERIGYAAKMSDIDELMKCRAREHVAHRYFYTELFSALLMGYATPDECVKQFDAECDELIRSGKPPKSDDRFGNYVGRH